MADRVVISKKLVLINSASSLATRLLSMSVLVWLQQYLLKRISPEEYSLLPVLYSVMAFAPLITTVLTGGIGRFITVAYARDDDEEVTRIVSTMFPILCAAGLVFLAGGWTFAWNIDAILTIAPDQVWDARVMMAILMFSAAVRLPLAPFGLGFFVRQKFVLENLISVGTEMFRLTLLFILLFGVSTRVLWIITASTIAEFVSLAITRSISIRLLPAQRFRRSSVHWPIAGSLVTFGGWSFLGQLADTIRTSSDAIILNKLATPVDVAAFHVGTMPIRHAKGLSAQLRHTLSPALFSFHATNQQHRLSNAYLRVGRLNLQFYLGISVPLFAFAPDIIALYAGTRYSTACAVMQITLPFLVLPYLCTVMPVVASAMNKIRHWCVFLLVYNSLNLAITLLFVWKFHLGALGSALGTLISAFLTYPYAWWLALHTLQIPLSRWLKESVVPGLAPGLIAVALSLALRTATKPTTWPWLGVCLGMSALIYGMLLFFFIQPQDRNDIRTIMSRLRLS